uniref:Protein containing RNA polI A34 domain n=1 Tax=Rhipicephalus zambeziensis TaxID=60191 RepID=A0A224Y6P7_9ACAR
MPSAAAKKYEVPSGFTATTDNVALPVEEISSDEHRLWLIRTPTDVNISNLDGMKISLKGGEHAEVQIGDIGYEFTRKEHHNDTQRLSVLLQEEGGEQLTLASGVFCGMATLTKKALCPEIPQAASPSKRPRLDYSAHESARQRFVPFGSDDVVTLSKRHKDKAEKVKKTKKSKK